MKIFVYLFFISVKLMAPLYSSQTQKVLYPILDTEEMLLGTFSRSISDLRSWRSTHACLMPDKDPLAFQGLCNLKASGSGQFSQVTLEVILNAIPNTFANIIFIDLRQESHGFINGQPVSWASHYNDGNRDLTLDKIEEDEISRLHRTLDQGEIFLGKGDFKTNLEVKEVHIEKELVEKYGKTYLRIPVTDRNPPSDEIVNQFIAFVNQLPSDVWLHFHCKGGQGRTTTFLVLLDMIKNHAHVSMEDIIARHHIIGGSNLLDLNRGAPYLDSAAKKRLELVQKFYCYCQEVPDFDVTWSQWNALSLINN